MKPRTASCWALAASALLAATTVSGDKGSGHFKRVAAGPAEDNAVAVSGGHARGILDDLANLLDPTRLPRADGDSDSDGPTDDETTPTTSSTTTPTTPTSTTSTSTTTSRTSSTTDKDTSTSTTTSTRTSSTRTSSTRTSSTRTSSTRTTETTTDDETTPTPSPTTTSTSKTDLVVVTVTRPDVTITTKVPPPPIIDQSDGDKADVGAPSNLVTIIVAPTVTAVALLLCAIMYFMYSKRKNRLRYGDEDIFAKSGGGGAGRNSEGSPFSQADHHTSPFILREHSNNTRADGYIKEENTGLYNRTLPPAPRPAPSFGAHPMANPRYQQQVVPLVQPSNPGVVPGTARYMPPPAPTARYGSMQGAPGYAATNERDSQFTETFAYEPPQLNSNHNSYNGNGNGGHQQHPGYSPGNGGRRV